jgi:hypothetical protein
MFLKILWDDFWIIRKRGSEQAVRKARYPFAIKLNLDDIAWSD